MHQANLSLIDLNLLVALEVLLEELHISKAAERLNMSQPNMSRTLKRLQETFDDPIIVRKGNSYFKTVRAEQLQQEIAPALEAVRRSLQPGSFDPASSSATFKIFGSDYGEAVLVPHLFKKFLIAAPKAKLEVARLTQSLATEVHDGPYDLILGILHQHGFPKQCEYEPLFEDRYVCVMCQENPAADRELTLDAYVAANHSVVTTNPKLVNRIDARLDSLGSTRNIVKWSPYVMASLFSLCGSDLLQTTPLRLVEPFVEPLNLVIKELPFETDRLEYCQVWHVQNSNNLAHQWFRKSGFGSGEGGAKWWGLTLAALWLNLLLRILAAHNRFAPVEVRRISALTTTIWRLIPWHFLPTFFHA